MKRNLLLTLLLVLFSVSCSFSTLMDNNKKAEETPWIYSLYENSMQATWRSGSGSLNFSSSEDNPDGFVGKTDYGYINPGVRAVSMLETRPQMTSHGWVEGLYPEILLPENVHLRSYIGFKKGADASDGVTFHIFVHEGNTYSQVAVQKLFPRQYKKVDINLSPWAGKKIQLILKVSAGNHSKSDLAVWVNPRLDNFQGKK
ncbi:MAG: hypothetical protein J7J70_01090 [Deltaproteobacteria bacterium]|nr:hypothetical protein [Candidatus Tharpellaceae bacterium]